MKFRGVLAVAALGLGAIGSAVSKAQNVVVSIPKETAAEIGRQAGINPRASQVELLGASDYAVEEDLIPIVMRDGVELSGTVIRPKHVRPGTKLSVLYIKSPYRNNLSDFTGELAKALLKKDYAIVMVHDRGQQWSRGSYTWLKGSNNDNWDVLDWIQKQPWSNGRVGTIGCSSSSEWMLSFGTKGHPALKAMVPMGAATGVGDVPGYSDKGIFYAGGATQLLWAGWYNLLGFLAHPEMPQGLSADDRRRIAATFSPETGSFTPDTSIAKTLPSADILKVAGSPRTIFDELITWEPGDPRWDDFDFFREGDTMKVPALHIGSWFDLVEAYPTARHFEYVSRNSKDQYLIVGGSTHCGQGTETADTKIGEMSIGDARFDWSRKVMTFLDHYVKNDGRGSYNEPAVRYFLMGDKWRTAPAWPIPGARKQHFYLSSTGRANSLWGDGRLTQKTEDRQRSDTFVSDPMNPVPSKAASCCDPKASQDQRDIEARADVLVYTSEPLQSDLDLAGYVTASFHISSTVPDADIAFKLVDVAPSGAALNVLDTIKRVRYRNGVKAAALMEPGKVYPVEFTQAVTALRLKAGHRLRIEIAGSNFPAYERNMQTGGRNALERNGKPGAITVWHGPTTPSHIAVTTLP